MDRIRATRLDRLVIRQTIECWRPIRHPAHNIFIARLRSFDGWPKHGEAPSPTSLSKAGFFYDGTYRNDFEYLFLFQFHIFIYLYTIFSLQVDWWNHMFLLWGWIVWMAPLRWRLARACALVAILSVCICNQRRNIRSAKHSAWRTHHLISVCRSQRTHERNTRNQTEFPSSFTIFRGPLSQQQHNISNTYYGLHIPLSYATPFSNTISTHRLAIGQQ